MRKKSINIRIIIINILTLVILSSCATGNIAKSSKIELRNEKKLAEQALVKEAVESRKYIIKLDKIYFTRGGMADLIPRTNYIIIDGSKAIISAAYLGRQLDIRPIAGINLRGKTINYELSENVGKGIYEIKMRVDNGSNTFDIGLSISKNGSCNASLSSIKIDNVRYSGYVVPIKERQNIRIQRSEMI